MDNNDQQRRKRGRPRKQVAERKVEYLDVRLDASEKKTFKDAAAVAGIPLSMWVRERLRRAAIQELESVGKPIELLKHIGLE